MAGSEVILGGDGDVGARSGLWEAGVRSMQRLGRTRNPQEKSGRKGASTQRSRAARSGMSKQVRAKMRAHLAVVVEGVEGDEAVLSGPPRFGSSLVNSQRRAIADPVSSGDGQKNNKR
jgi:hypothetical protein